MSKTEKLTEQALLSLSGGNNSGGGSAQEQLAALLAARIAKEMALEEADKQQQEAYKEQLRAAVNKTMRDREAVQAQCPHMKPNFRPALGGQRDHQGNYHYICQYCAKEWNTKETGPIPYHLQIPADTVGGPQ